MMRILIVEDEELIRNGLKLTTPWNQFGCEVIGEAVDGIDGEEQILKLKPDIVITDIKMPKRNGLEMIENLRGKISCEYIILSGYDDFSYAKTAMKLEVHGYLLKPVDDEELEEVLNHTIRRIQEKKFLYEQFSRPGESRLFENLDFRNLQDKYLDNAFAILKANYADNLTLKIVADELNISDSYLGKLFKSKTNYTFLEMLTLYRMQAAVELLQNTDKKIYEVSYIIGYSDSKYFSKLFRKITGLKPMELKNGKHLPQNHILNRL